MVKVGILTFHSQCNYGGVLQAWALQKALETLGYEAVIIDRWEDVDNRGLLGPFATTHLKTRLLWLIKGLIGCGQFADAIRYWRTIVFVRSKMKLTPYHFVDWEEVKGRDLGFGCILVGSDQVWHCGDWGDPRPYLLEGAPQWMPKIAYASSFGMQVIPNNWREVFEKGIKRFSAIGLRESEGVSLVTELGGRATHVLDPTQLVAAEIWKKEFLVRKQRGRPHLVCYFLEEDVWEAWPALERFADRMGGRVDIFVGGPIEMFPKSIPAWGQHLKRVIRQFKSPIRLRLSADPQMFVEAFHNAKWIIADSFHAIMFASLFQRDIRIVRPKSISRQKMFARIEEFVSDYTSGPLLQDSVNMALESFEKGENVSFDESKLKKARECSRVWLQNALRQCEH